MEEELQSLIQKLNILDGVEKLAKEGKIKELKEKLNDYPYLNNLISDKNYYKDEHCEYKYEEGTAYLYCYICKKQLINHSHKRAPIGYVKCNCGSLFHFKDGKLNDDEGKAAIRYSIGTSEYWWNGNRHNLEGPAINDEYYIFGKNLSKDEWEKQVEYLKNYNFN